MDSTREGESMDRATCALFYYEDIPTERAEMVKEMTPPEIEVVVVSEKPP